MNADEVVIRIGGGVLSFVYSDDLAPLLDAGVGSVRRASHVEPAESYGLPRGGWVADMKPSGGPLLAVPTGAGLYGFATRQEALDAERDWLRVNRGL